MNKAHHITIRFARLSDASELVEIYRPYVTDSAISFEYEVPSTAEFSARMKGIQKRYPYLVAELDDQLVGYAYAHAFVGRRAYDWSVETTIYLRQDRKKQGIGKKLYEALECVLREMHIYNLYACIGVPEKEDEYLTTNSLSFHRHMGYSLLGEFHRCGYKFGRWYHMVWMEKLLDEHPETPPEVCNVNELRELLREKYQIS